MKKILALIAITFCSQVFAAYEIENDPRVKTLLSEHRVLAKRAKGGTGGRHNGTSNPNFHHRFRAGKNVNGGRGKGIVNLQKTTVIRSSLHQVGMREIANGVCKATAQIYAEYSYTMPVRRFAKKLDKLVEKKGAPLNDGPRETTYTKSFFRKSREFGLLKYEPNYKFQTTHSYENGLISSKARLSGTMSVTFFLDPKASFVSGAFDPFSTTPSASPTRASRRTAINTTRRISNRYLAPTRTRTSTSVVNSATTANISSATINNPSAFIGL